MPAVSSSTCAAVASAGITAMPGTAMPAACNAARCSNLSRNSRVTSGGLNRRPRPAAIVDAVASWLSVNATIPSGWAARTASSVASADSPARSTTVPSRGSNRPSAPRGWSLSITQISSQVSPSAATISIGDDESVS